MKKVVYLGNSKKEITAFSPKARQYIVTAHTAVSCDITLSPTEFKYMATVGMGVYKLHIKVDKQYRVFFVSKFKEAVYVLHAFVKKIQTVAGKDIDFGSARYKALINQKRELGYN